MEKPWYNYYIIFLGACQSETDGQKRTYNAGNVASDIYYDDGIIILNYTGGDKCHNDQYERNTIISFVCSPEGHGQPVYIDETLDCTYYIAWHTDLVCEQQVGTNCYLRYMSTALCFSAILPRGITFMTSCLLLWTMQPF